MNDHQDVSVNEQMNIISWNGSSFNNLSIVGHFDSTQVVAIIKVLQTILYNYIQLCRHNFLL